MGRHGRWPGLLIAGAIALATAPTVQADPLPELPQVSVPSVTTPQVSVPSVTTPSVSVPAVPQVSVPSVTTPQVSVPSVTTPQVSVPSRPTLSSPGAPQVATSPLSSTPAPTRTQQLTRRPRSASSGATPAASGSSSASGSNPDAPGPAGDRKAGDSRDRRVASEPSSKRLRRLLEPLAACVTTLAALQERVIVRRAGLRGFKPQTRRQLAKALDMSRARVGRIERRALRNLRRTLRGGGCGGSGVAASETSGALTAGRGSGSAGSASSSGADASPSDRVAVKGVSESKSDSMIEGVTDAGRAALAAITEPARSFAEEHPLAFTLVLLMTTLCGVLLVRELRRSTV